MAIDLKLEGTALQQLIEGAVIQALGTTGQEALVRHVVQWLTTPTSSSYGSKNSPLLDALTAAAGQAANKYFREKVETDPAFVEAIETLYVDAVKKFLDSETREKTVERMADRLSAAFEDRYR